MILAPLFSLILIISYFLFTEAESGTESVIREPRGLLAKRRCKKYGICGGFPGGGGYGGHQGGYGGYPGGGYGGIPPINIGISQSQSSANAGGGGYGHGYYPNNYQYNNGFGGGHGGYQHRPGYFGNGHGSYNSQFNGNYYGGQDGHSGPGFGGYGFQGPHGNGFYGDQGADEHRPEYDDSTQNDPEHDQGHYDNGPSNIAASGSFAYAGRSNG